MARSITDLFDEHVLQPTYRMLNLPMAMATGAGDVATGLQPRTLPGPGGMPSIPIALLQSMGNAFMNQRGPIQAVPEWVEQIMPPDARPETQALLRGGAQALGAGAEILSPGPGELRQAGVLPLEAMLELHKHSSLGPNAIMRMVVSPEDLIRAGMVRPPKEGVEMFTASPERRQELFQKGASTPFGLSYYPKREFTDEERLADLARIGPEAKHLFPTYSVTSTQRTPRMNAYLTSMALDDFRDAAAEGVEPMFRGVSKQQADMLRQIRTGGLSEDQIKWSEYYDAMHGRPNSFVPDMWEGNIYGSGPGPTKVQQRLIMEAGRGAAAGMGVRPIDLQQGGWAGIRTEHGVGGESEPLDMMVRLGLMDPPDVSPFGRDRYRQLQQILADEGIIDKKKMEQNLKNMARRREKEGPLKRR